MINQISSNRFRCLNISFVDNRGDLESQLIRCRPQLTAIDEHLQWTNFVNFEYLTLGVPDNFVDMIKDCFPRTAERGLLRVMSVEEMDDLHAITCQYQIKISSDRLL